MASINQKLDNSFFVKIAEQLLKWDFSKQTKRHYIMLIVDFFFDYEQKKKFDEINEMFQNKWHGISFEEFENHIIARNKGFCKDLIFDVKLNYRGYSERKKVKIDYKKLDEDMSRLLSWVRGELKKSLSKQNIDFANYTEKDFKTAITLN